MESFMTKIFIDLLGKIGMKNNRISDTEFRKYAVALAFVWALVWEWFCRRWVEVHEYFGVKVFPDFVYDIYSEQELALSPFVNGLIFYVAFLVFLKLLNYPEELKEDEVLDWRVGHLRKWSFRFFCLGLAITAYAYLV